jgi:hypothetical protein
MKVRGGEFSTGTMGNFQPELTKLSSRKLGVQLAGSNLRTNREQNPPNTP